MSATARVRSSTILFVVTIVAVVGVVTVYNFAAPPEVGEGPHNLRGGGSSSYHLVITNSSTYLVTTQSTTTFTIRYYSCGAPNAPIFDSNQVLVNHTVMCYNGGAPGAIGPDGQGMIDFMNGSVVYLPPVNMNQSSFMSSGLYGYDAVVISNGTRFIVNASGVIATLYPYRGIEVFANGTITTFAPCVYPGTENVEAYGGGGGYNGTVSYSYSNGLTVSFYGNGTCSAVEGKG